ncbi:hypothetical protein F5B20DRAFT_535924 [Whalleya microplaca]|nr:hypothetical protein F5B20DRAFT_535924 [Whalleya microplaca]
MLSLLLLLFVLCDRSGRYLREVASNGTLVPRKTSFSRVPAIFFKFFLFSLAPHPQSTADRDLQTSLLVLEDLARASF